ncbi:WD repeat-containing protein 53-like [Dendronephthya gigantea]|uniref:WD repeat-containing protein 53-like n=1 Tax=Dendronephthya gigantea TaxID=151771 RepID=UPI001069849C|nr:WD repeat-containing protein 53-like [Dendronephthya gigantea]
MNFSRKARIGHSGTVLALDISTEGVLSSVGEDGRCLLWTPEGQIIQDLNVNKEHGSSPDDCPLNSVTFNPSESNNFYISSGTQVLAYDMRKCSSCIVNFDFNVDEINQLCVNDTGQYLAACDDHGEIKVIDIQESRLFKTLARHHDNICSSVQFRHKKSWQLLSAGLDCHIINWDFSSGKPQQLFNINDCVMKNSEENQTLFINPPFVHSLSVRKDGKTFATGLGNGEIGFFKFQGKKFECTNKFKAHNSEVSQVYFFSPDTTACFLVSAGNDGKINIWKETQTEQKMNYELCQELVHCSKINWIACSSFKTNSIFVADQSSIVHVYEQQ